jgi:hypothetical protein
VARWGLESGDANVSHGGLNVGGRGAAVSANYADVSDFWRLVFASGVERFARGEHLSARGLRMFWRGSELAQVWMSGDDGETGEVWRN